MNNISKFCSGIIIQFFKNLFYQSIVDLPCWVSFRIIASSVTHSCLTLCDPWTAARQASLSITNFWCLLKLLSIKLVMSSNHLILCHPLLLLPSIFPSSRVFSSESVLGIRWPNYWSFSISPSNEYSGLISFGTDWFDLKNFQSEGFREIQIFSHMGYHKILSRVPCAIQ